MLAQRVLSAVIGVPILLVVVWIGGLWFKAFVMLVVLLAASEFFDLAGFRRKDPLFAFGIAACLLLVVATALGWSVNFALTLGIVLSLALPILLPKRPGFMLHWVWLVGGILYVGWLLSHAILLRELPQGREWVLLALLSTFAVDIAAFFAGRRWGRRPLAPAISPAKTWEGAIGGFVAGGIISFLLSRLLGLPLTPLQAVILGVLVGFWAQIGDLAESMIKRSVGVKEAGRLIPGHGGILDRTDSVVFAIVVIYYYAALLGLS